MDEKKRIIAATASGQHGIAAAAICAKLGLQCTMYIGEFDAQRQPLNVLHMQQLGTEVRTIVNGTGKFKDALNEAMRDLIACMETTFLRERLSVLTPTLASSAISNRFLAKKPIARFLSEKTPA